MRIASGLRCDPKAMGSAAAPSRRNRSRMPDNRDLTSDFASWIGCRSASPGTQARRRARDESLTPCVKTLLAPGKLSMPRYLNYVEGVSADERNGRGQLPTHDRCRSGGAPVADAQRKDPVEDVLGVPRRVPMGATGHPDRLAPGRAAFCR